MTREHSSERIELSKNLLVKGSPVTRQTLCKVTFILLWSYLTVIQKLPFLGERATKIDWGNNLETYAFFLYDVCILLKTVRRSKNGSESEIEA
jgi:hypothetical protein